MPMKNPPHPGHSIKDACLDPLGLTSSALSAKRPHKTAVPIMLLILLLYSFPTSLSSAFSSEVSAPA